MENSNDTPNMAEFWESEATLMRRLGSAGLVAAGALAVSGRIRAAAKIATAAGGSLVISQIERRIGQKFSDL